MINKIDMLKDMIEYNKKNGASNHMLSRLRKELKEAEDELNTYMCEALKDWNQVYKSDKKRGKGVGGENSESWYVLKEIMRDNRSVSTKMTHQEREEYYEELRKFEEEHGKLPRLKRRI